LPRELYRDPARRLAFYDRVVEGLRALPAVEGAASSADTQGARHGFSEDKCRYSLEELKPPPTAPAEFASSSFPGRRVVDDPVPHDERPAAVAWVPRFLIDGRLGFREDPPLPAFAHIDGGGAGAFGHTGMIYP
jgi:hypothetical protein